MTEEEMNFVARATLAGFRFWRAPVDTKSSALHWYYSYNGGRQEGGMYTLPRAAVHGMRESGLISNQEAQNYYNKRVTEDVDIEELQALAMAEALAPPDAPQT